MSRKQPYQYWTNQELKEKLILTVERMKLDGYYEELFLNLVKEACDSKEWNPPIDFNGCTMVQDYYHPSPFCFVHDYMGITGRGGKISDALFYYLMKEKGISGFSAYTRWLGVRIGWYSFFLWKHIIKRTYKKPSDNMINLYNYFKNK